MTERKLRRKYHPLHGCRNRRWSKLGRDIRALFAPGIPLQIHCISEAPKSKFAQGSTRFPRYWLTLGKERIFHYPTDFLDDVIGEASDRSKEILGRDFVTVRDCYPYDGGVSDISELIRDYINRPKETLLEPFENDKWGLTDILRATDRRIGKKRLLEMNPENPWAKKIISLRLTQET